MKISFIIPVYNASSSIQKCLSSIVPYLERGCEAVVVDDGSTDSSKDIIDSFSREHEGIKSIFQKNKGQSAARNEAIRQASGDYIWCLDSDDWLSCEGIETIMNALCQRIYDVVVIGRVEEYCDYSKKTPTLFYQEYKQGMDFFRDASLKNIYRTQPWNMIVRRNLIYTNGVFFPEGRTFEDFLWSIKLLTFAKSTVILPVHPYHYLLANEKSLTKQLHQRDWDILWIVNETAHMLDESNTSVKSNSPAFLALTYWFVSSAIMKKYIPLYKENNDAKGIVDAVIEDKLFIRSVRYAAFHYIGMTKSGLAQLLLLSPRLYRNFIAFSLKTLFAFR